MMKNLFTLLSALIGFLLLLTLLGWSLWQWHSGLEACDQAANRLWLGQRLQYEEVSRVDQSVLGKKLQLPEELDLLAKGGGERGLRFMPPDDPEIVFLLKSLVSLAQARSNKPVGDDAFVSLTVVYRDKLNRLNQALVAQERLQRRRLHQAQALAVALFALVFSVAVLLVVKLLPILGESRRLQSLQKFYQELLRNQPYPVLLLNAQLEFLAVSGSVCKLLQLNPATPPKGRFQDYCCDRDLPVALLSESENLEAEQLRGWALIFPAAQVVKMQSAPHEDPVHIEMFWYRVWAQGEVCILGISENPPEGSEKLSSSVDSGSDHAMVRDLSSQLFRVQDNERRLLADELHDGLCQSLAALKMQVSGIERRLEDDDTVEECRRVRRFITQIIEDVRRLSHDLSPVVLEDLGLGDALAQLVNRFAALNGLKASVSVADINDLFDAEGARNLYRIVQEALNNIGKHSQASLVTLEVERQGGRLHLSLKDDGVGFDVNAKGNRHTAGLGLASMKQRAGLLDAELKIISRQGQGTEIMVQRG